MEVAGQAPSAAAISAALSAAFSAQMSVSAAVEGAPLETAAAAAQPPRSGPLLLRGGLPSVQLPLGEGLLGKAPGPPRQSSAPDALLSARCFIPPFFLCT